MTRANGGSGKDGAMQFHRKGRLAAAAALAALAAAPAPAPALDLVTYESPFGVVDNVLYDDTAALGAVWVRHPAAVWRLEPTDGAFATPWNGYLNQCESRRLNFSPVIVMGQFWMTGRPDSVIEYPSMPPTDLTPAYHPVYAYSQQYYDVIYYAVDTYRGRMADLTIENEANAENFWGGSADQYVRLLKTGYKAAHDADPGIVVFDSGMASEGWGACMAREWYEEGMDPEALRLWVNEYYLRDTYYPVFFTTVAAMVNWLYSPFVTTQYQRYTYILANMGGSVDALNLKYTQPYWLYDDVVQWIQEKTSQAGYSLDFICNNEASLWPGVTPNQYARELIQQYMVGFAAGVDRSLWFPLSWEITETPRVALIDSLGAWMPTATAYRTLTRIIGHSFAFDHLDTSVPNVQQYVFRHRTNPEKHLRVCWWDNGGHGSGSFLTRFDLPPVTRRVTATTYLGVRSTASTLGVNYLDLTVDHTPVFIEYEQDLAQVTSVSASPAAAPRLEQNFPNPFNPQTTLRFRVPGAAGESAAAALRIYDAAGRLVRTLQDGPLAAGQHLRTWSGEDERGNRMPAGVYLARFTAGGAEETRKMILAQ